MNPPAVLTRLRCHSPEDAAGLIPGLFRAGYEDVEIVGDELLFRADRRSAMDVAEWAWRRGAAPVVEPKIETTPIGDLIERVLGVLGRLR